MNRARDLPGGLEIELGSWKYKYLVLRRRGKWRFYVEFNMRHWYWWGVGESEISDWYIVALGPLRIDFDRSVFVRELGA